MIDKRSPFAGGCDWAMNDACSDRAERRSRSERQGMNEIRAWPSARFYSIDCSRLISEETSLSSRWNIRVRFEGKPCTAVDAESRAHAAIAIEIKVDGDFQETST